MTLRRSLKLILYVLPYLAGVIAVKLVVHRLEWEIIPLNAIFSALIGANVFLIGFLISGVLSDYKESEKLPGEIAAIVLTMADEIHFIHRKTGDGRFVSDRLTAIRDLAAGIRKWLYKEVKTRELMLLVEGLSAEYVALEKHAPPNYIARLKQEQSGLRKVIMRIHTIRETDFIFSGYFIASTTTFLLVFGMIFLKIEPFYESLFFVGLVTYLLLFLLRMIRDLDNPFGHYNESSLEDVSLKPILDASARIGEMMDALRTPACEESAVPAPVRPGVAAPPSP